MHQPSLSIVAASSQQVSEFRTWRITSSYTPRCSANGKVETSQESPFFRSAKIRRFISFSETPLKGVQKFCQLFVFLWILIQTGRSSLQKQTISNPPSISKPYPTLQKTCHPTISNPPNKLEVSSLECTFRTPLPEASSKALGFKVACQPFRNLNVWRPRRWEQGDLRVISPRLCRENPGFWANIFAENGWSPSAYFRGFCWLFLGGYIIYIYIYIVRYNHFSNHLNRE